jgi:hypothetical protein
VWLGHLFCVAGCKRRWVGGGAINLRRPWKYSCHSPLTRVWPLINGCQAGQRASIRRDMRRRCARSVPCAKGPGRGCWRLYWAPNGAIALLDAPVWPKDSARPLNGYWDRYWDHYWSRWWRCSNTVVTCGAAQRLKIIWCAGVGESVCRLLSSALHIKKDI